MSLAAPPSETAQCKLTRKQKLMRATEYEPRRYDGSEIVEDEA